MFTTDLTDLFNRIIVLDTETTGVDHKSDEIIEYCSMVHNNGTASTRVQKYKPKHSIPPESSAVHFISDREVKDCPKFSTDALSILEEINSKEYIVGHNLNFDMAMLINNLPKDSNISTDELQKLEVLERRICTLELAKKLYAENPDFANLTLGYLWFKLKINEKYSHIHITPHKAEDDVFMCLCVLEELTLRMIDCGMVNPEGDICEQLSTVCQTPQIYTYMPFGKHKGTLVADVPTSYLEWLVNNSEILDEEKPTFNKDFASTVCDALAKRHGW